MTSQTKKYRTSKKDLPTIAELKHLFNVTGAGVVYWRNCQRSHLNGRVAGTIDGKGYRWVKHDGIWISHHSIVFAVNSGRWPEKDLDHINRDRRDNRFENLREATGIENKVNSKVSIRNKTGASGVWLNKKTGRYRAKATLNYKEYYLGEFNTLGEAFEVRLVWDISNTWPILAIGTSKIAQEINHVTER